MLLYNIILYYRYVSCILLYHHLFIVAIYVLGLWLCLGALTGIPGSAARAHSSSLPTPPPKRRKNSGDLLDGLAGALSVPPPLLGVDAGHSGRNTPHAAPMLAFNRCAGEGWELADVRLVRLVPCFFYNFFLFRKFIFKCGDRKQRSTVLSQFVNMCVEFVLFGLPGCLFLWVGGPGGGQESPGRDPTRGSGCRLSQNLLVKYLPIYFKKSGGGSFECYHFEINLIRSISVDPQF